MEKRAVLISAGFCLATLTLSACSSNSNELAPSSQSPNKQQKLVSHNGSQTASSKANTTASGSVAKTVNSQSRLNKISKSSTTPHQQTLRQRELKRQAKLRQQRLLARQQANKARQNQLARNNQQHQYRSRGPQPRLASLRGDYAGNRQTATFIDRMVVKHGYDRQYLNYLFSNAELTPFLRRMSIADANLFKKKKRPRAGSWNRYRNNFLTAKTIDKGVQFWKQNKVALKQAEERYGVPQEYILGIIGVETRYGGNVGKNRAIDALAAMGFNNARRGKYFRTELESYLLETRKNGLDPLKPMASYAGALGLCQFMPSNIKRYGVDFDRDGKINLWTSRDAIGSVANYFNKHGWKSGGTVAVPATSMNNQYQMLRTGFKSRHSLARLKDKGVSARNLGNLSGKVSLIKLNTYNGDELWLGGHNFNVITRYNRSSHYAMAVHQLAQAIKRRIGGHGTLRQASLDFRSNPLN